MWPEPSVVKLLQSVSWGPGGLDQSWALQNGRPGSIASKTWKYFKTRKCCLLKEGDMVGLEAWHKNLEVQKDLEVLLIEG